MTINGRALTRKQMAIGVGIVLVVAIFLVVIGRNMGYAAKVNETLLSKAEAASSEYQAKMDELSQVNGKLEDAKAQLAKNNSLLEEAKSFESRKEELAKALDDAQAKVDDFDGQVKTLEQSIAAKKKELDAVTASVTKAAGEPKRLPAGTFTVGTHIPVGRYKVTGSSNFVAYTPGGKLAVNTILGGSYGVSEYVTDLTEGMQLECHGADTFTPLEK